METEKIAIMERLANDDDLAFNEIYHNNYDRLFSHARYYIDEPGLADDMVQDVFLALWNNRKHIKIHSSLMSYLSRCIYTRCIRYMMRRNGKRKGNDDTVFYIEEKIIRNLAAESVIEYTFASEINEIVEKTIHTFPRKTQRIFHLSRKKHLKNEKIAEMLGLSVKSIEYHITKVLGLLRINLRDYMSN